MNSKVATCLWFDDQAQQAAELYVSLIPNSKITNVNQIKDMRDGREKIKL